jgi:alginate O-acetyltransferase complex protein AlgJ
MGWGSSAGFAEQLSYVLRRPVDRLMQNDQGAFATRAMLQRDPGRLAGKRVVIYQFAARELTMGDWKILSIGSR